MGNMEEALQTPWERALWVNTSILFRKTRETGVGTGTERGEGMSSERQGVAATDHKDRSQQLQLWISPWRGGRQWRGHWKLIRYVGFLSCFAFETESHHRVLLCSAGFCGTPSLDLELSEIWLPLPLPSSAGIKGMCTNTPGRSTVIFF